MQSTDANEKTGTFVYCWWECKTEDFLYYLMKLNVSLLYDPAIPLLGIYTQKK